MTTVPLPGFLSTDVLDEFREFEGPLIYLAAPLGHRDPGVREDRLERFNRYCYHLIHQRALVYSQLSLGTSLSEATIPDSAWYALGLQMLSRCDEMRRLDLNGWNEIVGVGLEIRYARQLSIPVSLGNPVTYNCKVLHKDEGVP